MSLNNRVSKKSCSAVFTAGRNHTTGSLSKLSSIPRSVSSPTCLESIREARRNIPKQKSSLVTKASQKICQKCKKVVDSVTNVCYCFVSVPFNDLPKCCLRELKNQLHKLNMELYKEKNMNQLLKNNILVAKIVLKKEIAPFKGENLDSVLKKASDESWRGRQEIIFDLKTKLRDLNETIERIEGKTEILALNRKRGFKREHSLGIITDEQKIYWYIEFERREMWKNAERYKQKIIADKETLKNKQEKLIIKTEELMKEASNIRKQLSSTPKQIVEELVEPLNTLRNQLKARLEQKAYLRRKLDEQEQQICQNYKIVSEIKTKLVIEELLFNQKVETIKSLKEKEVSIHKIAEEVKEGKRKQRLMILEQMKEVEKGHIKIKANAEKILELTEDSKHLMEKLEKLQAKKSSFISAREHLASCSSEIEDRSIKNQFSNTNELKPLIEITDDDIVRRYENKLLKYQTLFQALDHRNQDKLRSFRTLVNKTKGESFSLLRKRCHLLKLLTDKKVLKSRVKVSKRYVGYPAKQKLKRKDFSPYLIKHSEKRKIYLDLKKEEKMSIKFLIKNVLTSKEDDCDLIESFFTRNKDIFLKELSNVKVRNLAFRI